MILSVTILGTTITKIPDPIVLTHLILLGRYNYYPHFTNKKIESLHNLMKVTQLSGTE